MAAFWAAPRAWVALAVAGTAPSIPLALESLGRLATGEMQAHVASLPMEWRTTCSLVALLMMIAGAAAWLAYRRAHRARPSALLGGAR